MVLVAVSFFFSSVVAINTSQSLLITSASIAGVGPVIEIDIIVLLSPTSPICMREAISPISCPREGNEKYSERLRASLAVMVIKNNLFCNGTPSFPSKCNASKSVFCSSEEIT